VWRVLHGVAVEVGRAVVPPNGATLAEGALRFVDPSVTFQLCIAVPALLASFTAWRASMRVRRRRPRFDTGIAEAPKLSFTTK
jgi:hypothetical protein